MDTPLRHTVQPELMTPEYGEAGQEERFGGDSSVKILADASLPDSETRPSTEPQLNQDKQVEEEHVVMPDYKYAFMRKVDSFFDISKRKGTFGKEIIGGITSFLACSYILAVNPTTIVYPFGMTGDPSDLWYSVFIATSIGSIVGTLVMAFLPNLPFVQAPGMGLNFQVGLLIAGASGLPYSFAGGMCIVFLAGCVFLLVSLLHIRDYIFDGVPDPIRKAIPVGIGLFIALVGLSGASLVVANPGTLVGLISFRDIFLTTDPALKGNILSSFVCLFGVVLTGILESNGVPGGVLISILVSTILGIPLGVTNYKSITQGWDFTRSFANFFSFSADKGGAFCMFALGFKDAFTATHVATTLVTLITFCLVDLFDTLGTLHGCAVAAGLLDDSGRVVNFSRCMWADSLGTFTGGVCGTSSVTTFVESGAGISAGARTGLASVVTALFFLLSIFISPVFSIIPSAATAPALIYVGSLMLSTISYIDFSDKVSLLPVFLTIVMMPLTYSITNGIGLGILSFIVISFISWIIDLCKYARKKTKQNKRTTHTPSNVPSPTSSTAPDNSRSTTALLDAQHSDALEEGRSPAPSSSSPSPSSSSPSPSSSSPSPSSSSSSSSSSPSPDLVPLRRPPCPITVVTLIIGILFLAMFLVPTSYN